MDLLSLYHRADRAIQGKPEAILTVALVVMAVALLLIALSHNRVLKGVVVAWAILP